MILYMLGTHPEAVVNCFSGMKDLVGMMAHINTVPVEVVSMITVPLTFP